MDLFVFVMLTIITLYIAIILILEAKKKVNLHDKMSIISYALTAIIFLSILGVCWYLIPTSYENANNINSKLITVKVSTINRYYIDNEDTLLVDSKTLKSDTLFTEKLNQNSKIYKENFGNTLATSIKIKK